MWTFGYQNILFLVPDSGTDQETITHLRKRLTTMKEIFGEDLDATETARRKRAARRRNGNCIGTVSFYLFI